MLPLQRFGKVDPWPGKPPRLGSAGCMSPTGGRRRLGHGKLLRLRAFWILTLSRAIHLWPFLFYTHVPRLVALCQLASPMG
jgi:hypothetical protein